MNYTVLFLSFCVVSVLWLARDLARANRRIRTLQDEIQLINQDLYFTRSQAARNAQALKDASLLLDKIRWKMEKKEHQ